jgi:hypothetical protein
MFGEGAFQNSMIRKKILVVSVVLLMFDTQHVQSFSADKTIARKRLGKKSFIQRQERGKLRHIPSSEELQELAVNSSLRHPGSINHRKAWKRWSVMAIDAIRYDLSANLPCPVDKQKFENLFFRLGVAADKGIMPSFEDESSRAGYALEFFCRARNLADLLMDVLNPQYEFPDDWRAAVLKTPMLRGDDTGITGDSYNMISLGGGPGFDSVALSLAASFSAYGKESSPINAIILDYEEGWCDLVKAMDESTRNVLQQPNLSCEWGGKCDITKGFGDPINTVCLQEIGNAQMIVCQYCVAENAHLLRGSGFIFFRDMFEKASIGALFIFTETAPRIWPDLCELMEEYCPYMQVAFVRNGRQMLIMKFDCKTNLFMREEDERQRRVFQDMSKDHTRKISSGWERQEQKIRGSV